MMLSTDAVGDDDAVSAHSWYPPAGDDREMRDADAPLDGGEGVIIPLKKTRSPLFPP